MTPERWQEIKRIFNSAIGYEPSKRSEVLAEMCGDDQDLRQHVLSLIEAHEKEGSFIDTPAYAKSKIFDVDGLDLKSGQTVGSYSIVSFVSQGGMGQVYLAKDTRLNRRVALKLLPASFTKEVERFRRFEQEARAASALNHPNILTIYEICEVESALMIASEFVEGETLRKRISSGALSIADALNVAIQIADALSAAHKAGIIHRDIKPENVMIRPDGYVKVLDFGLAKLSEPSHDGTFTEAPTQVRTGTGVVLGTIGYMSPEQARGHVVDARSDIFNMGTVIYEMIAGRSPFPGETASDVFAAILKSEPLPLSDVAPDVPPELNSIVRKALQKDRDQRYQKINELLADLKSVKEELDFQTKLVRSKSADGAKPAPLATSVSTAVITSRQSRRTTAISWMGNNKAVVLLALLLVVAVAVGLYAFIFRNRSSPPSAVPASATAEQLRTVQITTWAGFDCYPSLSPDGNSLVYSSDRNGKFEIYVKQLTAGGREVQLTSDGAENFQPAWSPDGKLIAYASKGRGGIWVVPAFGGNAKQLVETGAYPAWSPDGSQIAFQTSGIGDDIAGMASGALLPSTIAVISSEGGEARRITQVGNPAGGHGSPSWSPDSKRIVFASYDPEKTDVWSVSIEGDQPTLLARGYDPVYSPDGKFVYFASSQNGNFGISKIAISPSGAPEGSPVQLVASGNSRAKAVRISADGKKLAYGTVAVKSNIWVVPVQGSSKTESEPISLTRDTSLRNSAPVFSPDGFRIAYHVRRVGSGSDIYLMNADGANVTQLTTSPDGDERPNWFPDGEQIAFLSRRQGVDAMWVMNLKTGRERKLFSLDQDMTFPKLSPDGKQIVFNSKKSGTTNLWLVSVDGGEPRQLTFDKESMGFGCWSPDGKFIAFEMKRGDNNFLAIIPAAGGEPEQLNSDHGQSWPSGFSPDGDRITFAGFRNGAWNVWWYSRTTKEEKQVTRYTKLNAFVRYPSWSPQGDKIVYEYAETSGNIYMVELK